MVAASLISECSVEECFHHICSSMPSLLGMELLPSMPKMENASLKVLDNLVAVDIALRSTQ